MRKTALSLLMLFVAMDASAATYQYSCKSIDDNGPYGIEKMSLKLDSSSLQVAFADFYVESALYKLNPRYAPTSAGMKKFAQFKLSKVVQGEFPDGPIGEIYAEKQLVDGGYALQIGKQGGFVKMTGSHEAWASYLCWR